MGRTLLLGQDRDKVATKAAEMRNCRMRALRFIREQWRWYWGQSEIAFQGLEYDEETGELWTTKR